MDLHWLYDLPNWLFGATIIGVFTAIGLAGLFLTRRLVRRLHRIDHSHNDIVGFYLAAITVFYGITLGLVAVGTWETYSDVQNKVDHEAVALGATSELTRILFALHCRTTSALIQGRLST